MTSDNQRSLGPDEQHQLLYIDPFYLDRRNFVPDELSAPPPSDSYPGQDSNVAVPVAAPSATEVLSFIEHDHHSLNLASPCTHTAPQAFASASTYASAEPRFTCESCLQTFEKRYLLKYGSFAAVCKTGTSANHILVVTLSLTRGTSGALCLGVRIKVLDTIRTLSGICNQSTQN